MAREGPNWGSSRRRAATPARICPGAEVFRGLWGAGEGAGGSARAGHDVEHVEGAGAGGQSVSIGGQLWPRPTQRRGGRGKGSWPCARGSPRHAPPARPVPSWRRPALSPTRSRSRPARVRRDPSSFQNILLAPSSPVQAFLTLLPPPSL